MPKPPPLSDGAWRTSNICQFQTLARHPFYDNGRILPCISCFSVISTKTLLLLISTPLNIAGYGVR